ncbi:hypothetical protein Tco_0267870 [Tanacetum coccineum]
MLFHNAFMEARVAKIVTYVAPGAEVVLINHREGLFNDIYSQLMLVRNECEMLEILERLKQGESINVQDLVNQLYWDVWKIYTPRCSYFNSSRMAKVLPVVQKSGILVLLTARDHGHVSNGNNLEDIICMAQLQEVVIQIHVDNSGQSLMKSQAEGTKQYDQYNCLPWENETPGKPESSKTYYLTEQGDSNYLLTSSDICYDRGSG